MLNFAASAVSVGEIPEAEAFAVILAEGADGSGACLQVTKTMSFDEQDRANGMDTYCLGLENGASHYGGVSSWSVADGVLRMTLDPAAARALAVDGAIRVAFDRRLDPEVRAGLDRILGAPSSTSA